MESPTAEQLYRRETFIIVLCIFTGFILYDFVICLPEEIKYIFYPEAKSLLQRKTKRVPVPTLLLLLARLLVIPMVAVQLTTAHGQSTDCHGVYKSLLYMYCVIVANGTAVFIVRTVAIRSSRWPLQLTLWTIWLAHTVWWFYASSVDIEVIQLPKIPYMATCLTHGLKSWTWIGYLCNALFDILILFLTLQTQFQDWDDVMHPIDVWKRTRSDISQIFYRDAMMYFVISVAASLSIVGWIVQNVHEEFFTILIAPIHIWLHLSIAPRVIRTLKIHNSKAKQTSLSASIEAAQRGMSASNKTLESSKQGISYETSKSLKVSDVDVYDSKLSSRDEPFAYQATPVAELYRADTLVPFASEEEVQSNV